MRSCECPTHNIGFELFDSIGMGIEDSKEIFLRYAITCSGLSGTSSLLAIPLLVRTWVVGCFRVIAHFQSSVCRLYFDIASFC